jgi:hypothetical protein
VQNAGVFFGKYASNAVRFDGGGFAGEVSRV